MNEIMNGKDTKTDRELFERAEYLMEVRKEITEVLAQSFDESPGSIAHRLGLHDVLPVQEQHQLKGTAAGKVTKNLLDIAALGDTKERAAVISALLDPDNPASSLHEAKERAGLERPAMEAFVEKRAQSMNSDWASASPQVLERFVFLIAGWDHELASALLRAARISIKSWEES